MKQEFIIRKFKESDIEDLKKLSIGIIETQKEINTFFHGRNLIRTIGIEKEVHDPSFVFFVVEFNKELIGYASAKIEKRNVWFEVGEQHALLNDMFIDKSKYKNLNFYKIAFNLYECCKNWAKKQGLNYLCGLVYGENLRVRTLLNKENFKEYKISFVKDLSE